MAISEPHYRALRELHRRGELPQGGSILEIGEANWYGDISPVSFLNRDGFAIVKQVYADLFGSHDIVSIDLGGTPAALKQDLNRQLDLPHDFDVVYNHGTASTFSTSATCSEKSIATAKWAG